MEIDYLYLDNNKNGNLQLLTLTYLQESSSYINQCLLVEYIFYHYKFISDSKHNFD